VDDHQQTKGISRKQAMINLLSCIQGRWFIAGFCKQAKNLFF
jgi:hypothetical protein